jgi:hypothetical protein
MIFVILFSRLTPHIDKIIIYHLCRLRSNRPNTDQIFCIRQIQEKKWECNWTEQQLFMGSRKTYDTFKREVFYNFVVGSDATTKLIRKIKMYWNKTYSKVPIWCISIQNGLKQEDALSPLLFNFSLNTQQWMSKIWAELNWTEQISFWSMLMMLIYWVQRKYSSENKNNLLHATKEIGLVTKSRTKLQKKRNKKIPIHSTSYTFSNWNSASRPWRTCQKPEDTAGGWPHRAESVSPKRLAG